MDFTVLKKEVMLPHPVLLFCLYQTVLRTSYYERKTLSKDSMR